MADLHSGEQGRHRISLDRQSDSLPPCRAPCPPCVQGMARRAAVPPQPTRLPTAYAPPMPCLPSEAVCPAARCARCASLPPAQRSAAPLGVWPVPCWGVQGCAGCRSAAWAPTGRASLATTHCHTHALLPHLPSHPHARTLSHTRASLPRPLVGAGPSLSSTRPSPRSFLNTWERRRGDRWRGEVATLPPGPAAAAAGLVPLPEAGTGDGGTSLWLAAAQRGWVGRRGATGWQGLPCLPVPPREAAGRQPPAASLPT